MENTPQPSNLTGNKRDKLSNIFFTLGIIVFAITFLLILANPYFIFIPLYFGLNAIGFVCITVLIFLLVQYFSKKQNVFTAAAPLAISGSILGGIFFIVSGIFLNWRSLDSTTSIIVIGAALVYSWYCWYRATQKKFLTVIIVYLSTNASVYIIAYLSLLFSTKNSLILNFLSVPARCYKVTGGLGPSIDCKWFGSFIGFVILLIILGIVTLISTLLKQHKDKVIQDKVIQTQLETSQKQFKTHYSKSAIVVLSILILVPLGLVINGFYQSSESWDPYSFRSRVDLILPGTFIANNIKKDVKIEILGESLVVDPKRKYKTWEIDAKVHFPKGGSYSVYSSVVAGKNSRINSSSDQNSYSHYNEGDYTFQLKNMFPDYFKPEEIQNFTDKSLNAYVYVNYLHKPPFSSSIGKVVGQTLHMTQEHSYQEIINIPPTP